jgi:hypothetical protein
MSWLSAVARPFSALRSRSSPSMMTEPERGNSLPSCSTAALIPSSSPEATMLKTTP